MLKLSDIAWNDIDKPGCGRSVAWALLTIIEVGGDESRKIQTGKSIRLSYLDGNRCGILAILADNVPN